MKIDPSDKLQSSPLSPVNKPASTATPSTAFADVLKKSMGTESSHSVAASGAINPIIPPLMAPSTSEIYRSTERMLDTMEQYQQLLENSRVNMRGIGAVLGTLKEEISTLAPLVDIMPEGDPIKAIARETLMTAAKEVTRYDGGAYI